ncbi:OLC1v1004379C2 [Oldenlandia corymbosa var. corymbosa]|uniref:OLC1v1004379C2 n=1 Tax=Oldenlandia corymbosa var. corymbosa TaxID=529605 RepID=A0AAV1DF57_OLDCO|nr:OLC1v1004379C2 [Oldenlandia corymbosa var. corymbosa]
MYHLWKPNYIEVLVYHITCTKVSLPIVDLGFIRKMPKVEEEHVIGFDGAAERVVRLLTGGVEHLETISIVGMLGLGKTTLAKMVYKDPDVDYEYMIRAFVYISREYDKKEVLLKILNSVTQSDSEVTKMDEAELEEYLKKQLEGKHYLIVLDDVWETKDWDKFKDAFPYNENKRCRVLVTTRNESVARHANRINNDAIYKLEFLPLEDSRKLLRWRVFHKDECPEELQSYEVEIANKCAGLPLALVVIAGVIFNHPKRADWWKHVANSVKDYIVMDAAQAIKVIELMYKHLPNHLKPCFLYLGVFREDFEIPVWKLVRLWVSEGLIRQAESFNLEDIAEQYLEELVCRNLVMVGQRRSNDRIKTCHVHDTLREFCKKEAKEENFFQEINKDNLPSFLSENPTIDQYRRLCINNVNVSDYLSRGPPPGKCVRSFLACHKEETQLEAKLSSFIPKAFKLLRVLEVQPFLFDRSPPDMCGLVLLKYIAISGTFSILPPAILNLWNLQTLIVNTTSRSLQIKAEVWKMPQFRHLHTNASTSLPSLATNSRQKRQKIMDDALSYKNVQTLCTISPESCEKEVFDWTPKLKKLGIYGSLSRLFEVSSAEPSLFKYLSKLESLENLKLMNDDVSSKLSALPPSRSFPRQLTKITLLNTLLDWKYMSTLGELDNLEVLKLKEHAFQGQVWKTGRGGFLRLKHLHIGRTDLVSWEASRDYFPELRSLELNCCDKLQAIPHGLADIPCLQSVILHCTNPLVASSARRLQVLRLEQANRGNRSNKFKLSVYPPEHSSGCPV